MPDTARTAYLFQCRDEDLYAVSHDITGANIPRSPCTRGWVLCEAFQLGRRASLPAPIMAEPVMHGIADRGYYVWRGWSGGSTARAVGLEMFSPPKAGGGSTKSEYALRRM